MLVQKIFNEMRQRFRFFVVQHMTGSRHDLYPSAASRSCNSWRNFFRPQIARDFGFRPYYAHHGRADLVPASLCLFAPI